MADFAETTSPRIEGLHRSLMTKAQGNRAPEWFRQDMFPDVLEMDPAAYGVEGKMAQQTVLVRRAVAIDVMLKAMTSTKISRTTRSAEIEAGDLLLGVLPMGSNGLGKVFPQFMTEDELRAGSVTNRNAGSLFGHNTLNYEKLLTGGLIAIIKQCDEKIAEIAARGAIDAKMTKAALDRMIASGQVSDLYRQNTYNDFYKGVRIACQAVVDYAHRFADIAEKEAGKFPKKGERHAELLEMARIARKVPEHPAETFHEAMQSITFFHIALHASMNFISLGRLDQVLEPYLMKEKNPNLALEIVECFLIKLAGRLNLSSDYLVEQDHVDYATVLGTHPYYIDQKAGVNNFLQNIILGGKTPDGDDAANTTTYLFLQALENVNLSTPGVYVRLHKKSPKKLLEKVAVCLARTRNNPAVLNDETMIPAMYRCLMQDDREAMDAANPTPEVREKRRTMQRLANDYCVDGCWEPILNGESDWTFTMLNAMQALEAAMNRGAALSPDPELFRGAKKAPFTRIPKTFNQLLDCFEEHLGFFVDQCVLSMYLYYGIDEYAAPSPLMSALMAGCMEKGRDKAWAGANYNLGGVIYGGVPNVVNTIAALRKWVFPAKGTGKYAIEQVTDAFRHNFTCADATQRDIQNLYTSIQIDFDTNSPKFGNNDPDADGIAKTIVDMCYNAVERSAAFGKKVFQDPVKPGEWKNIIALRNLVGYYGISLSKKYQGFQMKFSAGMGTFEQYNWQGRGIAACADRRSNEPIAPNLSPMPGTTVNGVAGLLESLSKLGLDRFAGGVITDICLEESKADVGTIEKLLKKAINSNAPMFTLAVGSEAIYREIYETVVAAGKLTNKQDAARLLAPYAGVNVRIGGWQTPFVTLPLSHMENYIHRAVAFTESL